MADNLTVVGKPEWIAEFLLRVEASVMSTAESLNEREAVAALIEFEHRRGRLFDLLSRPEISAYFNQANIENWTGRASLDELHDHNAGEIGTGDHRCRILIEPHPIFVRILQNMKTGSLGKDSSGCNPLPFDHRFYLEHSARIAAALTLLQQHCPNYYFLVSTFLRRLILVDDKSSFRGATSYYARGLAYFRPRESWDQYVWAEELVHEATHNQVHSLLTFDPLVTGENRLTQNVPGPLRPDMRHHFGNFQALHVISRLLRFNETLAAAGLEPDRLRARNAELMERCRVPVRRLASEAQLTEIGRTLFAAEIAPAFAQALCEDDTSPARNSGRDIPVSA
jgi:hypothetical protein